MLQLGLGNLAESERLLKKAVESNPRHPDAWLYYGRMFDQTNRPEEAKKAYHQALVVQPGSPEAEFNLAMDEQRTGQIEEAIKDYESLLTLHPNEGRVYHNLAVAYLAAGRFSQAQSAAEKSAQFGSPLPPQFLQQVTQGMAAGQTGAVAPNMPK